jgi:hypothetical protein
MILSSGTPCHHYNLDPAAFRAKVCLRKGEANLRQASVVNVTQIQTIDFPLPVPASQGEKTVGCFDESLRRTRREIAFTAFHAHVGADAGNRYARALALELLLDDAGAHSATAFRTGGVEISSLHWLYLGPSSCQLFG